MHIWLQKQNKKLDEPIHRDQVVDFILQRTLNQNECRKLVRSRHRHGCRLILAERIGGS